MTKEQPKRIELTVQEVQALIDRGQQRSFAEQDYPIVVCVLRNYFALDQAHQEKSHTVLRLLNRFFGHRTEKSREVLKNCSPEQNPPDPSTPTGKDTPQEKPKGHGRNGASVYEGAQKVCVPHLCYKAGDPCPLCLKGRLYPFGEPGVEIRIVGRAPLDGTVYELEKLRCNLCGKLFTAQAPEGSGEDKYDETAGTMVALLKYGAGLPFNRLEKLQDSLGVPLPASTQWEIVERTADQIHPVYSELIRQAAQGELLYNDDTTMKILANLKKPEADDEVSGKGSFTTYETSAESPFSLLAQSMPGRIWLNCSNKGPQGLAHPFRCVMP
jgi:transposase